VKLRYLLDTSIVSVPVAKKPDPAILKRLEANGPECAIAAPVWHELTYGCRRLPRGKRRAARICVTSCVDPFQTSRTTKPRRHGMAKNAHALKRSVSRHRSSMARSPPLRMCMGSCSSQRTTRISFASMDSESGTGPSVRLVLRRDQPHTFTRGAELSIEHGDCLTTPLLPGFSAPLQDVFASPI
jgi:hypothetical protein